MRDNQDVLFCCFTIQAQDVVNDVNLYKSTKNMQEHFKHRLAIFGYYELVYDVAEVSDYTDNFTVVSLTFFYLF